jgi:hypothetical protein
MTAKVYLARDPDPDNCSAVVAYASESDAQRHAADCGYEVEAIEVPSGYVPDPVAIERHRREVLDAERRHKSDQEASRIRSEQYRRAGALRPEDCPNKKLCLCRSFDSSLSLLRANGYCGYCGGWDARVFAPGELEEAKRKETEQKAARVAEGISRATAHVATPAGTT